ncbi:MAG: hypothetical protein ACR5KV_06470 [Wolbachia sp.]
MLVRKLKNFPLAMKQAITFIRNKKLGDSVFEILKYIKEYENLDHALPQNSSQNQYDRILLIILLIFIKVIQNVNFSKKVNQILNTMAYFDSSEIDSDLFLPWVKIGMNYTLFKLLEQYCMINVKKSNKDKCMLYMNQSKSSAFIS